MTQEFPIRGRWTFEDSEFDAFDPRGYAGLSWGDLGMGGTPAPWFPLGTLRVLIEDWNSATRRMLRHGVAPADCELMRIEGDGDGARVFMHHATGELERECRSRVHEGVRYWDFTGWAWVEADED